MKPILKLLIFSWFVNFGTILQAQQLVSSAGEFYQNSSGSLSFSVGELSIETFSNSNNILTQGFHQTNLIAIAIKELKDLKFEIIVFPNPTKDFVLLKIPIENFTGLQYKIYDIHGKLLQNKILKENETEISFANFSPSTYFIKVSDGNKVLKTFKIVKQ